MIYKKFKHNNMNCILEIDEESEDPLNEKVEEMEFPQEKQ